MSIPTIDLVWIFGENPNIDIVFRRSITREVTRHLARGKSILLLGPRQTGKTTLLRALDTDLALSLISPGVRQRYEKDPSLLAGEIRALPRRRVRGNRGPLVNVDEEDLPAILAKAI